MFDSFDHAIIVACHAGFQKSVRDIPENPEDDRYWVLAPFQSGEPPIFIEHILRGLFLASQSANSLLIFSGGRTHIEMGHWSEAATYAALARHYRHNVNVRQKPLEKRIVIEEYARDSFENMLFGICRFQQIVQKYPNVITVISRGFKEQRFQLHREALRIASSRFHFEKIDNPSDIQTELKGEAEAMKLFEQYPYGSGGELLRKRKKRDPFMRRHTYHCCDGMSAFFDFIGDPGNSTDVYPGAFPWE